MKRLGAIFLVIVHLTNLVGGYAIFIHQGRTNSRKLEMALDKDEYAGSEAITIRIPLNLPYSNFSEDYERAGGSFEHDGQIYERVKQKLVNDTLYVVCVKDSRGMEIKNDFKDSVASFSDRTPDSKPRGKTLVQLIKDFEPPLSIDVTACNFYFYSIGVSGYHSSEATQPEFVVDQPPRG